MGSGGQCGLAQYLFQVGGNAGVSLGPLMSAFVVLPRGQSSIAWFSVVALAGILILTKGSGWATRNGSNVKKTGAPHNEKRPVFSSRRVLLFILGLFDLCFSKVCFLRVRSRYS